MATNFESVLREGDNPVRNNKVYKALMRISVLNKAKTLARKLSSYLFPYSYRLHGDPILKNAFKLAGKEAKATSIGETGTYLGASNSLMAELFPEIPIYSSEINSKSYRRATKNLKKYKNVKVINSNSPNFLNSVIDKDLLGKRPMFFLDAHWLNYWPLEDEMKIISERLKEAIILIDDFKIPDNPGFKYDRYEDKECSMEMILPRMNKKNSYKILFPNYGPEVLKNMKSKPQLVGIPIIFQNLDKEFKRISNLPFFKKYYKTHSVSFKNTKS